MALIASFLCKTFSGPMSAFLTNLAESTAYCESGLASAGYLRSRARFPATMSLNWRMRRVAIASKEFHQQSAVAASTRVR